MKRLVVALVLSGIVAASAYAAEMEFGTVDSNGDGMVTMDEATAAGWEWTDEQFSAVDADGNGTLDEEEFTTAVAD
jgi:Ca2+-binding EF-hand superfamily protein